VPNQIYLSLKKFKTGFTISVPIYDVELEVGVMSNLLQGNDNKTPVGYLSIPEVSGCDVIIRAKGDNMAPKINSGDWIGVKRLDNWQEWIPMGYMYAIMTDQMELIKYVRKGSNPDTFTISSLNKFYEDDEIPKKVIKEVWSVKVILPFSKIETLV
jgi:phage repressor protein C with HTH and peptisase S24 domain